MIKHNLNGEQFSLICTVKYFGIFSHKEYEMFDKYLELMYWLRDVFEANRCFCLIYIGVFDMDMGDHAPFESICTSRILIRIPMELKRISKAFSLKLLYRVSSLILGIEG